MAGIFGIVETPLARDDRLAPRRRAPIVDRAVRAGVHALVANGNTGEFYGLTLPEAEAMVHAIGEQVDRRAVLIGGVGRGVHDACALARASRAAGASALMVHQPPDPFVSPRGVVSYVERIAEAGGGLPLMLYLRHHAIGLGRIRKPRRLTRLASAWPVTEAQVARLKRQLESWGIKAGAAAREPA